jgi:hypothetical protein
MATPTSKTAETGQEIRELAARLRTHRQHPCLIFVSRSIQHSDVLAVRKALGDEAGDHLDLIVSSPGGGRRGRLPGGPGAPETLQAACGLHSLPGQECGHPLVPGRR